MTPQELSVVGAILGVSLARTWAAYSARQAAARAPVAPPVAPVAPAGPAGWVDPRARQDAPSIGRGASLGGPVAGSVQGGHNGGHP